MELIQTVSPIKGKQWMFVVVIVCWWPPGGGLSVVDTRCAELPVEESKASAESLPRCFSVWDHVEYKNRWKQGFKLDMKQCIVVVFNSALWEYLFTFRSSCKKSGFQWHVCRSVRMDEILKVRQSKQQLQGSHLNSPDDLGDCEGEHRTCVALRSLHNDKQFTLEYGT